VDETCQVNRLGIEFDLAGFDLREVEYLVDEAQEVAAGRIHATQRLQRLFEPMMALRGVRSSWLMLERNCELFWLASASCRLLSWISSNSRTFSMAITAWSAKVSTSSICLLVNGRTTVRYKWSTPIGIASRRSGTPSSVRKPTLF